MDTKSTPSRIHVGGAGVAVSLLATNTETEFVGSGIDDVSTNPRTSHEVRLQNEWDEYYELLQKYKSDPNTKHVKISRGFKAEGKSGKLLALGKWLDNMRTAKRKDKLPSDRYEKLLRYGVFDVGNGGTKENANAVDIELEKEDSNKTPPCQLVAEKSSSHPYLLSYPDNVEELIRKSIAKSPRMGSEWLTNDLKVEIKNLRPDDTDIDLDGNRNVAKAAINCESFFSLHRHFCSQRQLEAALQEFGSSWGFTCARHGMSFRCHFSAPQKEHTKVDDPNRQREVSNSAKVQIKCPFSIKFAYIRSRASCPDWAFSPDGVIRHSDCYPVKITWCCYEHKCTPGVLSQRYALKRSGSGQLHIERLGEMINLLRDAGDIDNRMLRNLLQHFVPSHTALTDQYLRNFKSRLMNFVMDPSLISKRKHDIEKLMEGEELAANEVTKFDEGVMGNNLRLLLIGQIENEGSMWHAQCYLDIERGMCESIR